MKKDGEKFKRNPNYDSSFESFFEQQYKIAIENNDMALKKELNEQLFDHLFGFVFYKLNKYSSSILENPQYRDDLIQDAWLAIYENAEKYQSEKGAFTTYFDMWIRNAGIRFCYQNIYHTSQRYYNYIRAIEAAVNECNLKGIEPDIETISQMTNLSKRQIANAELQKAHSKQVSFSEEWEASVLKNISGKRRRTTVF